MKLVTAATMREMDRRTIEDYLIPGIVLMENAALRVVEAIVERYGPLDGKKAVVVCGKGNNGGDGFAIARHLAARHAATVDIWTTFNAGDAAFKGDAKTNFEACLSTGMVVDELNGQRYSHFAETCDAADIIVDAILGTGFHGAVADGSIIEGAIHQINPVRRWARNVKPTRQPVIVAVDIPSGVDADTGAVDGVAVRADLTVTFGLAKPGLICYPGAEYVGDLVVADIGLAPQAMSTSPAFAETTEPADVAFWLPRRENGRDTNKGKFGHVLVLAGSRGFMGAANMVSHASARTGAGLVTLAVPESLLNAAMSTVSPVVMTKGLPETKQGTFAKAALDAALDLAKKVTAVAIGPGIGAEVGPLAPNNGGTGLAEFVREFIKQCPVPIVIDADALNILAAEPDHGASIVSSRAAATVLTPHPGEMGRLIGKSTKDVQNARFDIARDVAERYKATVLLKGARTLVATEGEPVNINTTGNPGMATGGAGDVLTGIIAALLGMKLAPHAAASAGAYVHGLAGDIAAERNGGRAGLVATDLIDLLPAAIGRCDGN